MATIAIRCRVWGSAFRTSERLPVRGAALLCHPETCSSSGGKPPPGLTPILPAQPVRRTIAAGRSRSLAVACGQPWRGRGISGRLHLHHHRHHRHLCLTLRLVDCHNTTQPKTTMGSKTLPTPTQGDGSLTTDLSETVWSCDTLDKAASLLSSGAGPIHLHNFISGSFQRSSPSLPLPAEVPAYIDSFNPKTGTVFSKVPCSQPREVETAIQSAKDAFPAWKRTTRADRSRYLRRVSELLQENRELFAVWESIDQGKPIERARVEVDRAISNFAFVAPRFYQIRMDRYGRIKAKLTLGSDTSPRISCTSKMPPAWSTASPWPTSIVHPRACLP